MVIQIPKNAIVGIDKGKSRYLTLEVSIPLKICNRCNTVKSAYVFDEGRAVCRDCRNEQKRERYHDK